MPDVSVSLGLDYAAFTSQASTASKKTVGNALRDFSKLSQEASKMYGTAVSQIGLTEKLTRGLAAPITAPFAAAKAAMLSTIVVAGQAARMSAQSFNREFKIGENINARLAPMRAKLAPFTTAAAVGIVTSIQNVRKQRADHRAEIAKTADDVKLNGAKLRQAEQAYTAAQGRVRTKINQLSQKTGIKNKDFAFWQHDPRMKSDVAQMNKAGAAVAKARDAFQASAKAAHAARQAGTGFMTTLKQIGGVVAGGLGTAFRVVGSIVNSVGAIVMTVLRGIWHIVVTLTRSVLLLGSVLATVFIIGITRATGYGKELDALSRKHQFAVRDIEAMRLALNRSRQTAASTAEIMAQMRESLFFGAGPNILQNLGLNLDQLQKMSPLEQFKAIAEVVNRIANPIVRARVATALLGQAGADALAQFQAGDADLSPALKKYVEDMQKGATGLQMAADHWARIKLSANVFFNTIAAKIAPILESVARFVETKLIPLGQLWGDKIGESLKTALQIALGLLDMLVSGDIGLGEILKLSFQVAVNFFANLMVQTIKFTGLLLWETLKTAFSLLGNENFLYGLLQVAAAIGQVVIDGFKAAAELLLNPSLYIGMAKLLAGVALDFGNAFLDAIEGALEWMRDGLQFIIENIFAKFTPGMTASTFEQIREENKGKKVFDTSAGHQTADNLKSGALADFQAAVAGVQTNPMERAKETAKNAMADFMKVDFSGFMDLLKSVPELWQKSATDLFSDPALVAKLSQVLAEAQKRGAALTAGTNAKPKPGEVGGTQFGMVQTRFDDLRRVGAGLASSASNSIQRLGEKQLAETEKMRQIMQQHFDLVKQNVKGGSPRTGLASLVPAG